MFFFFYRYNRLIFICSISLQQRFHARINTIPHNIRIEKVRLHEKHYFQITHMI